MPSLNFPSFARVARGRQFKQLPVSPLIANLVIILTFHNLKYTAGFILIMLYLS